MIPIETINMKEYNWFKSEIKTLYNELLTEASNNVFLTQTKLETKSALENLSISDEDKAKSLIAFYSENTKETLSQTFNQAIAVVNIGLKLPKEIQELDAKIDLVEEQTKEVTESIKDRKDKRQPEITILNKQASLIDEQINKLKKDIAYVEAQKGAMEEQVEDNKLIKAMDSLSDMIATLGNGGLVPNTKMFETFFKMNKTLTGEELPGDYSVTKK